MTQTSPTQRNQGQEGRSASQLADEVGRLVRADVGRSLRADAARNDQRLIAAAREAFAERGAAASLDDVAKRAGVGPGTLYRHFPNRGALVEAVYLDGVRSLCAEGDRLLEAEPPTEALIEWLRAFAAYVTTKHGLAKSLLESVDNRDRLFRQMHEMINKTGNALLDRAKSAGTIRLDIELTDLTRLASAVALACEQAPDGEVTSNRLLLLAVDGLRRRDG